ncbi:hypothetical protein C8F04DRAFT_1191820 [Mycena alexandri]|uniref:Uncharacterized protein n=1 Tax=Mycena alexandri TaxID=1745969 RepID=A0AAD6SCG5_9AGAR|nr:hypothetical protein C8F04DRAFT_1191820 [Mycena alexandri]
MTEHDNVDVAMARAGDPSPAQTEPEPALPRSAPSSTPHGIPQGLAVMLRHTAPWSANVLYSVVPSGTLTPVDEVEPAPEWYVVYRGRFVGVMDQYMQAHWAIWSVSNAAHKTYATQAFALEAFNKVLSWGGVEVLFLPAVFLCFTLEPLDPQPKLRLWDDELGPFAARTTCFPAGDLVPIRILVVISDHRDI